MKYPTVYDLSIVAAFLTVWINSAAGRPLGFSELSLLVRMQAPQASIKSENEVFTEDWYPTNGVRNWRYTPYNGSGGTLYNGRGDFRDTRSINFSDSVAVSSRSVSRPIAVDWNDPVFFDGQPYTFYPVYV